MILLFIVDQEWNIGKDNDLAVKIKDDQKMFREKTLGNICLMGRNTFDSLPKEDGLADRVNIVVTSRDDREDKGDLYFVHSVDEAYDLIDRLVEEEDREVYCIGGAHLADQVIDKCSGAFITKVDQACPADTRMMNLDELEGWEVISESQIMHDDETGNDYKYVEYKNNNYQA